MPPPTMSLSTLPSRFSSTVSLVETLEPATIAMSGRFGLLSAFSSASSSLVSNGPAQATGANLPTPCVLASARCAVRERVHHVDVAERGHLLRQLVLVLLLALVEAHVLEQHDFAGLAARRRRATRARSARVRPSSSDSRAATGASENSSAGTPSSGRPRCDISMTRASAFCAATIVGSEARMRASLVTTPLWTGTLRSSRIRTRLPARSSSFMRRTRNMLSTP